MHQTTLRECVFKTVSFQIKAFFDFMSMRRRLPLSLLLFAGLVTLGGCSQDPAGETVGVVAPKEPVGLEAIRQRGALRVLTRNNSATYFVLRGKRLGFDYELAEKLAESLGVKLEVIVPNRWSDILTMLETGEGDIAAAGIASTLERRERFLFSDPVAISHMRIVWGRGQKPVRHAEELAGKRVHVRKSSSYFEELNLLNNLFKSVGLKPIDIVIEGETIETEKLLIDVASGNIPYSVADYHICLETSLYHPSLVIGPQIGPTQSIGWAIHKQAPQLAQVINSFLSGLRKKELSELYRRYYRPQKRNRSTQVKLDQSRRISAFDDIFRNYGDKFDFDWRLLASLAFEESHFNPAESTKNRGKGLFGMMPRTAKKFGVKRLLQPERATLAAASQLSALKAHFETLKDPEERLRMSIAAFQAGPGHIDDARTLASKEGLNADRWSDVSKVLPLLSLRRYASKARHGFVQGHATVEYTNNVWERYRAYRHALGERDDGTRAKSKR